MNNKCNYDDEADQESKDVVDYICKNTQNQNLKHELANHELQGKNDIKSTTKTSFPDSTIEKLSFFSLGRRMQQNVFDYQDSNKTIKNNSQVQGSNQIKNHPQQHRNNTQLMFNREKDCINKSNSVSLQNNKSGQQITPIKLSQKFVKNSSLARLIGNTYNTKKSENEIQNFRKRTVSMNNESFKSNCEVINGKQKLIYLSNSNHQKPIENNFLSDSSSNTNNGSCIERFKIRENIDIPNQSKLFVNNNSIFPDNYQNQFQEIQNLKSDNIITPSNSINQKSLENNYNNNSTSNTESLSHTENCRSSKRKMNNNFDTSNSNVSMDDFRDDNLNDFSSKAFRTISRSLGKLWWKRTQSVQISSPDPEYKVSYLGNVLTGWAKGDGCVEKPLNTLWKNYTQNNKADVFMKICVCASGLKATTRQHGLTEYWANRITHCSAPKNYPRVFCWVYRHEGRKLKHELRCHAILCSKESIADEICKRLRENLDRALYDFKKEKLLKQNARLSLANSVYDNPSLPRRKILLCVGGNNYRPPMERSKSAPKLMVIEEAVGEEDGEGIEQTNEPETPSCCQKDSLYPAMTLGRRHCRRGHSIRRTGRINSIIPFLNKHAQFDKFNNDNVNQVRNDLINPLEKNLNDKETYSGRTVSNEEKLGTEIENINENVSAIETQELDDYNLEELLNQNDYNISSPLAGELLSYFDMKLHSENLDGVILSENDIANYESKEGDNHSTSSTDQITYDVSPNTNSSPIVRRTFSLENLREYSHENKSNDEQDKISFNNEDELYIFSLLHNNFFHKLNSLSMCSDDSEDSIEKLSAQNNINSKEHQNIESDAASISSGCETASIVTNNFEECSIKYPRDENHQNLTTSHKNYNENNISHKEIDNRLKDKQFSDKITPSPLLLSRSRLPVGNILQNINKINELSQVSCCNESQKSGYLIKGNSMNGDISDSEFSDESGFVEYLDKQAAVFKLKK